MHAVCEIVLVPNRLQILFSRGYSDFVICCNTAVWTDMGVSFTVTEPQGHVVKFILVSSLTCIVVIVHILLSCCSSLHILNRFHAIFSYLKHKTIHKLLTFIFSSRWCRRHLFGGVTRCNIYIVRLCSTLMSYIILTRMR
jgi:hypothetical protein